MEAQKKGELEKLSPLENKEREILITPLGFGKLFRKTILSNRYSVIKMTNKDTSSMITRGAEKMRKSLDLKNIVKFHHSYLEEEASTKCSVFEPMEIADGTLSTAAKQRTDNLREQNIWRVLNQLSSALVYLHS